METTQKEQELIEKLLSALRGNERISVEIIKDGKKDIKLIQNITEYYQAI